MTTLKINDKTYGVEFRHRTQILSPNQKREPGLHKKHYPIMALTTCVILHDGLVGVGHSLCLAGDVWWRRKGLRKAFEEAARDCTAKVWDLAGLLTLMNKVWPMPKPKVHKELTEEEVAQLKAAGAGIRATRKGAA